ncbi:unnamed protein product [Gordionus sp. m RMFG-2023]|uniref:glutamate--cysteine ligase catalytic subunit-like n=1 Tax=Gordionus sp. m RMFG-2023 TaxID=3053472 RepID=UPI0030E22EAC
MGLLSKGIPLTWDSTKKYKQTVKEQGILQFINIYHKLKDRNTPCLMWGDEIEYMLVSFDDKSQKARVLLKGENIVSELSDKIAKIKNPEYLWHPEFASYMVEGTPGLPYLGNMAYFNIVEANMKSRRDAIRAVLKQEETVLTLTSFPRLGCEDFCDPATSTTPGTGKMRSLYIPDKVANNSHPRFLNLASNILQRKGRKVDINIPIYQDDNTPKPFIETFEGLGSAADIADSLKASIPNHVYMDSMCFGMGCCCLQVTFQACNIDEARYLYDQLGALCPIMLALTAASPIFKGYLTDRDCRWDVIAGCVDDRTDEELGLQPSNGPKIRKSRYDSIDCYISYTGKPYNDIPILYDKDFYNKLVSAGVDELLAEHIAHLFIRDPVILFEEKIVQAETDSDHFENIQSTNWQTMRFKPPPPDTDIGWRVEFRPQEVQLTDFENAAYVVFIVLLTRVILSYNLNFLIPISKMELNMAEAQKRNAVIDGLFYFHYKNYAKRDVMHKEEDLKRQELEKHTNEHQNSDVHSNLKQDLDNFESSSSYKTISKNDLNNFSVINHFNHVNQSESNSNHHLITDWKPMNINEIINGNHDFPGLVQLVRNFLDNMELDVNTRCTILQYLELIERRASGKLFTMAHWIREFVTNHPDYKKDSKVSELINYDLLRMCDKMTKGDVSCPFLIADLTSKSVNKVPEHIGAKKCC